MGIEEYKFTLKKLNEYVKREEVNVIKWHCIKRGLEAIEMCKNSKDEKVQKQIRELTIMLEEDALLFGGVKSGE